ncbi:MAG: spore cortex biosynthesis protein YabQ [Firmicutes bacterium]|nr:spore cortex biosynthesis protein YabQ [Lachnospiraceae bacterium]MDD6066760.1 spore cortex biosynthesis protein YabQ [Bacillota bacterium]MDY2820691.1 spore cortex biosynthesis protein YabQ [Hominisplanchenecus sp.]
MNSMIANEAGFFLISFFTGVLVLFGYDILRALRLGLPHSGGAVSTEDFLYWCGAGAAVFVVSYVKNNGSIRGFALAALGLGMIFYHLAISKAVVKVFSFFFCHVFGGIAVVFRVLLLPAGKSVKKMRKIVRKTLKKKIKEVRIVITKK